MRLRTFLLSAAFTAASFQSALAWDDRGHRIIARIADHYLSAPVRKQIEAILAADTDQLAPHDIVGASTWADRYRDSATPQHYLRTAEWHFAQIDANRPNIPQACYGQPSLPAGTPASEGAAKACIIDKIDQFRAELADVSTAPAERLLALKYLLHLVGDVHAPLHVADFHNRFGQVIQVAAGDKTITPGTLFGYWDSALVRRLGSEEAKVAEQLIAGITADERTLWSGQVTHFWALEAHQYGIEYAYGMLSDYGDGRFVIPATALEHGKEIVAEQLSKAGVRLAVLLNTTLTKQPATASAAPMKQFAASGQAIAAAMCNVCHVIDTSAGSGPPQTTAPDFSAIASTRGMSEAVLRSFLTGPHPTMPQMRLSEDQLRDVIAYIMSRRH